MHISDLAFRVRAGAPVLLVFAALTTPSSAETLLERGTYLMDGIVGCGNCHTAPGGPFKNKELAGGLT